MSGIRLYQHADIVIRNAQITHIDERNDTLTADYVSENGAAFEVVVSTSATNVTITSVGASQAEMDRLVAENQELHRTLTRAVEDGAFRKDQMAGMRREIADLRRDLLVSNRPGVS